MTDALVILVAVFLLGGLLHVGSKGLRQWVLPVKTALSCLFIIAALLQTPYAQAYFLLIILGLLFCLAGDVLLELPHPKMFLLGLVSFLVGHLFYVMAFFYIADSNQWTLIGALLTAGSSAIIYIWLKPHLGSMHLPVVIYIIVISAMLCGAWTTLGMSDLLPAGRLLVFGGALSFYLSDLFVARERFLYPSYTNRIIGLPLYYAGQFMIAFSIGSVIR